MIRSPRAGLAAVALALLTQTKPAEADPQVTADLNLGVAGSGEGSELWGSTSFLGGVRGELLLGRGRDADFGVGPFAEVLTTGFSQVQMGGGGALLVPVHAYLPLVISAGAYGGSSPKGWYPGVSWEVFWGTHGYNYHAMYSLCAGLFVGGRHALEGGREHDLLAGVRLDLEVLALPILLAVEALRGAPSRQ